MASRGKAKLPEDQLREKEKDGRIRRLVCDILTLRIVAYICAQPATFTFIIAFIFITLAMPPMAIYIRHSSELPDLDTMRVSPGTIFRGCYVFYRVLSTAELECISGSSSQPITLRGGGEL